MNPTCSKKTFDKVITTASWEERFILGAKHLLDFHEIQELYVYRFKEYLEWTKDNVGSLKSDCKRHNIKCHERPLSFEEPAESWKTIRDDIRDMGDKVGTVLLDITTMPRETIWSLLDILEQANADISISYHIAEKYDQEWLSRNPGRPRLVYRLAGESRLGVKTDLLVLAGQDRQRIGQLFNHFEPIRMTIGFQKPGEHDMPYDAETIANDYKGIEDITTFEYDCFSPDQGESIIEKSIEITEKGNNMILSSLGPKLSAIALYRIHRKHRCTSLAYAPSNEFNKNYSSGRIDTIVFPLWPQESSSGNP